MEGSFIRPLLVGGRVAYLGLMDGCSLPSRAYAGIGARETPPSVLSVMREIGVLMAEAGWALRTGFSPGADQAFYSGACSRDGRVELYLPWPGFEGGERRQAPGVHVVPRPAAGAYALASRYHPCWDALDPVECHLRARDVHQVLGTRLDDPVELVICWTVDASVDGSGSLAGGTGQALRVAHDHRIPVLNLARAEHLSLVGVIDVILSHKWAHGRRWCR